MKRYVLAIACLVVAAAASARAAEPQTIEEVIAAVGEATASIETWSADMEMTTIMDGVAFAMTGTMRGKGKQVLSETKLKAEGQVTKSRNILDSNGIYWFITDTIGQERVVRMDMGMMQDFGDEMFGASTPGSIVAPIETLNPAKLLEMAEPYYDLEFVGMDILDGLKVYVITGSIKEELIDDEDSADMLDQVNEVMGKIILLIGVEDGFCRSMQRLDPDDSPIMSTMYKNVVLNAPMDDSLFNYTPPEGLEVMDMSSMLKG